VREKHPNKKLDQFEQLEHSLKAHPYAAQLLLELRSGIESLQRILEVLNEAGIRPKNYEILEEGDTTCILLRLRGEDLKEAVFRLTEAGFSRLKGISPLR